MQLISNVALNIFLLGLQQSHSLVVMGRMSNKSSLFFSFSVSFVQITDISLAGYPNRISNRPKELQVTAIARTNRKTQKELEKEKKRAETPVLRNGHLGAKKKKQGPPWPS
ncbi:hypothetical protein HDV63DRAFT_233853 [Trichoderma sp. SZMC 28014]